MNPAAKTWPRLNDYKSDSYIVAAAFDIDTSSQT